MEFQKGKPNEDRCYRSIKAIYNFLIKNGVDSENIILYGRSLGSGPTVHLASSLYTENKKIAGMILQSPISSAIRVVSSKLAALPIDMFENIKKVEKILCPIFITHGTVDEVVPFRHGYDLQAKVTSPYLWKFEPIDGAGHNNIESEYSKPLLTNLVNFLNYVVVVKKDPNSLSQYQDSSNSLDKIKEQERSKEDVLKKSKEEESKL